MARIVAVATANPPHRLDRPTIEAWCARVYPPGREREALLRLASSTGIESRALARPVADLVRARPFAERNAEYAEAAVPLAEAAARRALDRAGLDGDALDLVITTSCTGVLIPSLAALLAPRLRLRPDARRVPITELGCAAGAAAIGRARDFLVAFPSARALVLAVELPSLTFQVDDASMANLVATSLFGDGAAAAILAGDRAPPSRNSPAPSTIASAPSRNASAPSTNAPAPSTNAPAPSVIDARSHLWPDSAHLMGFRIGDGGFHIVLDRDVPDFLAGRVRPLVEALCRDHRLTVGDLRFAAIHPGGRRILRNLETELSLPPSATAPSWSVLRRFGNMSSATVLFVLDEVLRGPPPPPGSYGLLAAFGPGFAAELALLRWP